MAGSDGLTMTRQRRAILEELARTDGHPTADELYHRLRKDLPRISLGTIYRNLELLAEHGLVRKLEVAGSQKRFDADTSEHYHVRCERCGRVEDVAVDHLGHLDDAVAEASEYRILGHRLKFVGVCPACQRKEVGG